MRKRNNNNNQRRHGSHSGGQRRYNNNSGGNRSGGDHQNLARQKHHATQMREKYMNHARDAQINGDRVDVEYYLQHVDHYNRILAEVGAIEAERQEKFREQQQAQQAAAGEGQEGGEATDAGNDHQGGDDASSDEPAITPGNQPRMTRGPRHHGGNQPRQQQADHNGAQAANANKEEIPLPGGVLGAI